MWTRIRHNREARVKGACCVFRRGIQQGHGANMPAWLEGLGTGFGSALSTRMNIRSGAFLPIPKGSPTLIDHRWTHLPLRSPAIDSQKPADRPKAELAYARLHEHRAPLPLTLRRSVFASPSGGRPSP